MLGASQTVLRILKPRIEDRKKARSHVTRETAALRGGMQQVTWNHMGLLFARSESKDRGNRRSEAGVLKDALRKKIFHRGNRK